MKTPCDYMWEEDGGLAQHRCCEMSSKKKHTHRCCCGEFEETVFVPIPVGDDDEV